MKFKNENKIRKRVCLGGFNQEQNNKGGFVGVTKKKKVGIF